MRQDIVILRDGFSQFQVKYKVSAYRIENKWHIWNTYFARTIQIWWRIGIKKFGPSTGVECIGGGLEILD